MHSPAKGSGTCSRESILPLRVPTCAAGVSVQWKWNNLNLPTSFAIGGIFIHKCACSELSRSRRNAPLLSDRVRIRTVNEHKFCKRSHAPSAAKFHVTLPYAHTGFCAAVRYGPHPRSLVAVGKVFEIDWLKRNSITRTQNTHGANRQRPPCGRLLHMRLSGAHTMLPAQQASPRAKLVAHEVPPTPRSA